MRHRSIRLPHVQRPLCHPALTAPTFQRAPLSSDQCTTAPNGHIKARLAIKALSIDVAFMFQVAPTTSIPCPPSCKLQTATVIHAAGEHSSAAYSVSPLRSLETTSNQSQPLPFKRVHTPPTHLILCTRPSALSTSHWSSISTYIVAPHMSPCLCPLGVFLRLQHPTNHIPFMSTLTI